MVISSTQTAHGFSQDGLVGKERETERRREKVSKQIYYLPLSLDGEKENVVVIVLNGRQNGVAGRC